MDTPTHGSWGRLQVALISATSAGSTRPMPFADLFLTYIDEDHADGDRTDCRRPSLWYLARTQDARPNNGDAAFCGSCGRRLAWTPTPDGAMLAVLDWWTPRDFLRWWRSTAAGQFRADALPKGSLATAVGGGRR